MKEVKCYKEDRWSWECPECGEWQDVYDSYPGDDLYCENEKCDSGPYKGDFE